MAKAKSIHLITTGGTIDSFYNPVKDTVTPNKISAFPDYLKSLKLYDKLIFTTVFLKDSRDITRADLRKLQKLVEQSKSKHVIIAHGTYTMPDTARFLAAQLKRKDQVIIFTGSMIPLIGFSPSDAGFNLGYSLAIVQQLTAGIYVCMNGRVFSPNEVVKDLHEGRFASVFGRSR